MPIFTIRGWTADGYIGVDYVSQDYEITVKADSQKEAWEQAVILLAKDLRVSKQAILQGDHEYVTYHQYTITGKTINDESYTLVEITTSEEEAIDQAILKVKERFNLTYAGETGVEEAIIITHDLQ